ncbi:hypothetical protein PACTADRAFT_14355 [Pachysolen tannophilus NRRL Y-2460]|uniref:Vacuolar protein sorting-associated protein 55 n=1 Tax=Pachysolen tannophilus NRRL Y-2460 TaxID=669874 RepID=A0A1E4U1G7_PACTA|nr:hypothetical protein PACTADRAFT_14355 [Pachysolen tannophilus NRRL Y-2460]
MPSINPLTKIIGLSAVLAAGFLMIFLAGAIYGNWLPILVGFLFGISHLPIIISNNWQQYTDIDFMNDTTKTASELGRFVSAFLTTTSSVIPFVFYHCHILTKVATILTFMGGLLIYSTVVIFTSFFNVDDGDELNFEI